MPLALEVTPAYAGKSHSSEPKCRSNWDHPRVCGEKRKDFETANRKKGSPPRVRGKAEVRHERDREPGITPACAGKRHCPRFRPGKTRDHPRVCGEKSSLMQMDVGPLGSPPRMRGKGLVGFELDIRIRITPACAGKSLSPAPEKALPGDHPRMCGEKFNCNPGSPQHWGSPPHMRGKAKIFRRWSAEMGITPAYAGKSARILKRRTEKRDHPRVCGEKAVCSAVARQRLGSPPRMRGKVPRSFSESAHGRITPAYAGKRLKRSHRIGHFSCILCLFHSVLHRASASGGSRAGPCAPPCLPAQNAVPV